MVEAEEEYTDQMETLVSCFLRPFKMAASSKKPPCSHEDVNSIFLNSETVLFLHQIFLKGLTSRMESWPTLVLGQTFICIYYFTYFNLSAFYYLYHTIILDCKIFLSFFHQYCNCMQVTCLICYFQCCRYIKNTCETIITAFKC